MAEPAAPESAARIPTALKVSLFVTIVSIAIVTCFGIEVWNFRQSPQALRLSLASFFGMILIASGTAAGISLDRERRGKPTGAGRFVAICPDIFLEYKAWRSVLLPIAAAIDAWRAYVAGFVVGLLPEASI